LSEGWPGFLNCSGAAPNEKRQSRPTPAASLSASTTTPISRRERVRGRCIDGAREGLLLKGEVDSGDIVRAQEERDMTMIAYPIDLLTIAGLAFWGFG
jgi:hypothetical protein